jgi:catechol 2,3-dioxygenase-like lactoylglutathione lyase family enzyme
MPVSGLHHYTLRCAPEELPALHDFYTRVIGLTVGDRPEIPAPGYWLYADGQTIVHLYAHLPEGKRSAQGPVGSSSVHVTGPLDHISFRAHGLAAMRAHLAAQGVASTEAPVPGWPLHQVFVHDPKGLKIEMTFDLTAEDGV